MYQKEGGIRQVVGKIAGVMTLKEILTSMKGSYKWDLTALTIFDQVHKFRFKRSGRSSNT